MTRLLLVFDDPAALVAAARQLRGNGVADMDAHVPFHMPELDAVLDLTEPPVRAIMLGAALIVGALTWGLQWWTATRWYSINSGGRPDNSWQIFTFAVFEMGVLAAAFAGLIAMFACCGLPRLHHPFFATATTERASDDLFYLSLPDDDTVPDRIALSRLSGLRQIVEVAS
ncbi:DUF3341 domain-containing protein [Paracoccus stylophorae]|uniref:DUF3341 domain-containing protein n=1 Tax=Paracoccus stylophorae TaxID=659350 RepID=A0ABY7SXS6_9RHOB|nr:DUF3341 domain-containing protein [Paracoccus stylophorae]WCR11046.1 DUF3341 domain-containing protein [Paracoccus stylophorae]